MFKNSKAKKLSESRKDFIMKRKLTYILLMTVTLMLFIAGCSNGGKEQGEENKQSGEKEKIRFVIGPYQPTPQDTRTAFEPFIKHVAQELGVDYEMAVTNDWAGIAVALSTGQADVAWMGPWSYVLSYHQADVEALATVKYDGKPTYQAIIVANPEVEIENFPEDAKGMSISFADVGSTSGWLVPSYYFHTLGINPKEYFQYTEGATHPANEISVIEGTVDLATDYDRNRNAMLLAGTINENDNKIVWESDPLPNDPIVVRKNLDADLKKKMQEVIVAIDESTAKEVLPEHYTGFVKSSHEMYKMIEDAGIALEKIDTNEQK